MPPLGHVNMPCRAEDGYAGFNELYQTGKVTEVACMAHSFPRQYVTAMVSTFGHGSTQVMRTAIARRGLNLPKD